MDLSEQNVGLAYCVRIDSEHVTIFNDSEHLGEIAIISRFGCILIVVIIQVLLKPSVPGRSKNKLLLVKVLANPNKEHYFFSDQKYIQATRVFWIPVYSVLEPYGEVHVVNPLFIKYVHGRKTVALESVWIAEIALNGMFKASYIPS